MIFSSIIEDNQYFPELEDYYLKDVESKHGILNVGLIKNKNVITGYQWNYQYFDGEKIRYIHSYDLTILRQRVIDLGHEWIIVDNRKAIDSYKLNNKFKKIHEDYIKKNKGNRKYRGSSGVNYVTIARDNRYNKKYWRYMNNGLCLHSKSLSSLKERVLSNGGEWIIRDEELYHENLHKDDLG